MQAMTYLLTIRKYPPISFSARLQSCKMYLSNQRINWYVTGTYDFFGLNYYSLRYVKSLISPIDAAISEFLFADITASPEGATDDTDFRVRNITISQNTFISCNIHKYYTYKRSSIIIN
jgi:beta-glucosidase/6-phospho-beta-glucosidase/beta-galactosidase